MDGEVRKVYRRSACAGGEWFWGGSSPVGEFNHEVVGEFPRGAQHVVRVIVERHPERDMAEI